jgi:hypothetical protein
MKMIATTNPTHGFFGSVSVRYDETGDFVFRVDPESLWGGAFRGIKSRMGWDDERVREWLDSCEGRHSSDVMWNRYVDGNGLVQMDAVDAYEFYNSHLNKAWFQ